MLPHPLQHCPKLDIRPNAPNLVIVRRRGAPGAWDGELHLWTRARTNPDSNTWTSMVVGCATRPGWATVSDARDGVPVLLAEVHEHAWRVEDGVLRCIRPVKCRLDRSPTLVGSLEDPIAERYVHIVPLTETSRLEGLALEPGAAAALTQAITRLQPDGARPLTITLMELE